ncbi:two-component system phosphate regulon sensor histidine kinase PhoR [Kordia periserrulae]|uniref:histidine kinase n=1 Tax=Kordia periserrulae TaxID=701523 RepID=A0A2T6C5U1_9FLAO|nr:HAMP domain-containing sensor histidine kinase [Kordia periserrulae]PTX63700.1 two-component system phosphate regulon sensor histidine kinase PhoR [Kordia periserrulae]
MKQKHSSWILYGIIATIAITIAVQVYWNYKNYIVNKQQFINHVQISLDNAVEAYYADVAKREKMMFITMDARSSAKDSGAFEKLRSVNFDSIITTLEKQISKHGETFIIDSGATDFTRIDSIHFTNIQQKQKTPWHVKQRDSIRLFNQISSLYISISEDSLNFKKLQTFLDTELHRKQIDIPYSLQLSINDSIVEEMHTETLPTKTLKTFSKSAYYKPGEKLALEYANITMPVLKKSMFGILISTLLSLAIISSLLYLLRVIRRQKQLAEIKNDLISNITHEFKTPITTISTALEAIQHFGAMKDPEKTQKYLSISDKQLKKLHVMVEKLLETATLDSEKLLLKKELVDMVDFAQKITDKQRTLSGEKTLSFRSNVSELPAEIDTFHFENAMTNLIDNALKYGGDTIEVNIAKVLETIEITVSDNGNPIDKSQRDKIFDKFYRIPKGNTHDVKGFGIGLYYTKKIIEKHGGTIQLVPNTNHTIFKITLFS